MDTGMFIAAIGLCLRAIQEGDSKSSLPYWTRSSSGVEVRLINDRIDVCLQGTSRIRGATTHYHLLLLGTPAIHQLTLTPNGTVLDACALPEHVAESVLHDIHETLSMPGMQWHSWGWIGPSSGGTEPVLD